MNENNNDAASLKKVRDVIGKLTDWYWEYGIKRAPEWRLGAGWLERLYAVRRAVDNALTASTRPATGIWGPSQAGKSSMLTRYIDIAGADEDPQGMQSAITWDSSCPARFRGCEQTRVALNPYNGGKDATGCVTRYSLRESVEDPRYPVEVLMAGRKALIHALAAGYLTECRRVNEEGEQVVLNPKAIDEMLADPMIVKHSESFAQNREAYELLRDVCEIVESLAGMNDSRYMNLARKWRDIVRNRLLSNSDLTGSVANVKAFMAHLLWDNQTVLSSFLDTLLDYHKRLNEGEFGHCRVFCTMEAASILISISSYENLINPGNDKVVEIAQRARSLSYDIKDDRLLISCGEGRNQLCPGIYDFGLFQACVLELVIPLRMREGMSEVFKDFLRKTDFLDFPGVAQEAANDGDKEQDMDLKRMVASDPAILTRLMKRGRTASIISSYSAKCDIDNFVLTIRAGRPVSNPSQLINGIEQWWRYADPKYDHRSVPHRKPPLPLYIVLTFCAGIVNEVIANGGSVGNGLDGKFDWLSKLGPMASPDIAGIYVTTYKGVRYTGTEILDSNSNAIHDSQHPELQKALRAIYQDGAFRRLFGNEGSDSYESFRQMALSEEGGTDFFFGKVSEQIDPDRKSRIIAAQFEESKRELCTLLEEALPKTENADSERQNFLCGVADAIDNAASSQISDAALRYGFDRQDAWVSFLIRSLQAFKADKMTAERVNEYYIHEQLGALDKHLPDFGGDWPLVEIGIENRDSAYKLARYLSERVFAVSIDGRTLNLPLEKCIFGWYSFNCIGDLHSSDKIRGLLAMVIENALWRGYQAEGISAVRAGRRCHGIAFHPPIGCGTELVNAPEAIRRIEEYGKGGDWLDDVWLNGVDEEKKAECVSPEIDAVVTPFVKYLRELAAEAVNGGRKPQPGDDILAELKSSEI